MLYTSNRGDKVLFIFKKLLQLIYALLSTFREDAHLIAAVWHCRTFHRYPVVV